MQETKLLKWLRRLSSVEFDDFILFVESPYHNKNTAVIPLIKYLRKYHPELTGTKLAKELVCRKIHRGEQVKKARLHVLMSQSLRLLEDFLTYETVKHNPLTFQGQQVIAYRDRQLDKAFIKSVKATEALLETERQDQDYHFAKYRLNREVFYHPTTPRQKPGMPSLEGAMYHLDAFFTWEKINLSALAFNRMRLLNEEYEFLLLNSVQSECYSIIKDSPVLAFSHKLMLLLQTEDIDLLEELIKEFETISSQLNFEKGQTFLFILLNFSVLTNRKVNVFLEEQIFTLYEIGLRNEYLKRNGKISKSTFIGIITAGCKIRKFDWVNDFIDLYKNQISPVSEQNNTITLGKSIFEFAKAEASKLSYDKSINYLQSVTFSSVDYAYRVKSMLLRLFLIERLQGKQDSNFVYDFAVAYERQVQRDTAINKTKRNSYLQFIKIVKLMIKYQDTRSEKTLLDLKKRLENKKSIYVRKWLSEKIKEAPFRASYK